MTLAVLHIGKYFPPHRGGMENYLADLMAAQQRRGLPPAALVHGSRPALRDREETVTHGGQALRVRRAAVWLTLFFAPLAPLFAASAARLIRRQRPALLHLHLPNVSAFWLLLLPAARRLPWIVHWHADVVASPHSRALRLLYPLLYRPLEQALLRRAAAVIATSPPYLRSSEPLAAHRERCHVIPLGLDPRRLGSDGPAPNGPDADRGGDPRTAVDADPGGMAISGDDSARAHHAANAAAPLRVVAVGRLTYYKGLEYLVDAAAQCPAVRVTLVGDGERAPALRRQIAAAGIADRVRLAGALDDADLAAALRGADLLCLPSIERTEAFGMVLLEAMALGVPVLATRVPGTGMAWIVQSSGAGRLVDPGDAAALAGALRELAADRATLRTLGARGQAAFSERFHIERGSAAIAALYRASAASAR